MSYHRITTTGALIEGRGEPFEVDGRSIVLFRSNGAIYALDDRCPHAGARLDRGAVTAGLVFCPLHGGKFELATGQCRTPRLGVDRVITHRVRIVDDQVEVELADKTVALSGFSKPK